MFRWLNAKRGQNTAEYAILIGVIVAAAIAMQIYIRRGMQARVKDAVDFTTTVVDQDGNVFFNQQLKQYEPYYMDTNFETTQNGSTSQELQQGGGLVKNAISEETTRTGNQTYSNYTAGNL